MPRTLAIGDVHGCALALSALIAAVDPQPDDTLVLLGDYIDRGPDSRGVVDQLLELHSRCRVVTLLGNHELVLLGVVTGDMPMSFWIEACGGQATLASYGGRLENIPLEHWQFFRDCRRYWETDDAIFVHANYAPQLQLHEQPDEVLLWLHLVRIPAPHQSGKRVIVGHTPQRSGRILDAGHVVCIDTFCCGDGCLTALDVQTGAVWQATKEGILLATPGD